MIEVISLEDSTLKSSINEQLKGADFVYLDAISDSGIIESSFDQYLATLIYGRTLRPAEMGCSLSHRTAIKNFLKTNGDWRVILEDDAIVTSGFLCFVEGLSEYELSLPIMLVLGHSKTVQKNLWWQKIKQPFYEVIELNSLRFGTLPYTNFVGTVGYALNKNAAFIINNMPKTFWIADDWRIFENAGIKVYHAATPLVFENLNSSSSTANIVKPLHSLFSRGFFGELWIAYRALMRRYIFKS